MVDYYVDSSLSILFTILIYINWFPGWKSSKMGVKSLRDAMMIIFTVFLLLLLSRFPSARDTAKSTPSILHLQKPLSATSQDIDHIISEKQQKNNSNAASLVVSNEASAVMISKPDPKTIFTRDLYVGGHETAHPELCPASGIDLKLVVLVTSAPSHFKYRAAVRFTWGHYSKRKDVTIAFVLGIPPAFLRPAIEEEDALYGDIIMSRSIDTYSNLTLKTLSMLEWVATYCHKATRFLKTDDDMFVNVPRLLSFAAAPFRINATKVIWGKLWKNAPPDRLMKSKHFAPLSQFPKDVYPTYASGTAYLMTADCVKDLLAAAPSQVYLRLEDVFVTGILASKVGIVRKHIPEFYVDQGASSHPCTIQRSIAIHNIRHYQQFDFWRKQHVTKCFFASNSL